MKLDLRKDDRAGIRVSSLMLNADNWHAIAQVTLEEASDMVEVFSILSGGCNPEVVCRTIARQLSWDLARRCLIRKKPVMCQSASGRLTGGGKYPKFQHPLTTDKLLMGAYIRRVSRKSPKCPVPRLAPS